MTYCKYNELMNSNYKPDDCCKCARQFGFPYSYCCLEECGEHEFCRNCEVRNNITTNIKEDNKK